MNSMNYKTLEKLGRAVLYGNILSSIHTDAQAKVQFDMALEMFKKYIGNVYDGTLPDPTAEGDECLLRVDNEYTPYKVVEGVWKKYTTAEGTTTEADLTDYYTKAETRDYVDDKTSDCAHKVGDNTFSGSNTFTGTLTATLTGNADTATKATKDSEGNVIKDTYATKTECSSKATLDATQMLAVNSGITATKVSEYEALKTSKANDSELSTVAKSGSYSDLLNKPTINDSTINVKVNGTSVGTFTTNNATSKDIAITVPTKMSDLDNDSDYIASPTLHDYALKTEVNAKQNALSTTQLSACNSGITSDKVAQYDGYATSKANDSDVVHTSGNETIEGVKTFTSGIISQEIHNTDANFRSLISVGSTWGDLSFIWINGKNANGWNSIKGGISINPYDGTNLGAFDFTPSQEFINSSNNGALGTSSNKWKTLYATSIFGGANNIDCSVDSQGVGWIRYSNGLQICWGLARGKSEFTVTLANSFINTEYKVSLVASELIEAFGIIASKTTTTFNMRPLLYNGTTITDYDRSFDYIAIGKWK